MIETNPGSDPDDSQDGSTSRKFVEVDKRNSAPALACSEAELVDEDNIALEDDVLPGVTEHQLLFATHEAEHSRLTDDHRLAVQHYRETLTRLYRKRDAYASTIGAIPLSPMGLARRPTSHQQDILFELSSGFFDQVYATLSALASVHSKLRPLRGRGDPPTRTNEKFLRWWLEVLSSRNGRTVVDKLMDARNFRTVNAHPQQFAVFDWHTIALGASDIRVMLTGRQSSTGNIPVGALRGDNDQEGWFMLAPSLDEVLSAFHRLSLFTFSALPGLYPLGDHEQFCSVEPDGRGSSLGVEGSRQLLRILRDLSDPHAAALLSPSIERDFERHIDELEAIRSRALIEEERRRPKLTFREPSYPGPV